jgi:hypothetical protein
MTSRGNDRLRSFAGGFLVLGSAVIVIVCVALAVPAYGFASRTTRTVVIAQAKAGSATAKCPKGEHVSFGGVVGEFKPPPRALKHPSILPSSMHRTAAGSLTVKGRNLAVGAGSHLSAIAYCDRGAVPRVVSHTVKLAGFNGNIADATCPAGTVVVGGGYASAASPTHVEYLGELGLESPTTLRVAMVNLSKVATTITASAYCGKGNAPTEVERTVTLAGRKGGTAHASCPAGTKLLFGGLDSTPPTGTSAHFSTVVMFGMTAPSPTTWSVNGYNVGDLKGTLTAIAYCR